MIILSKGGSMRKILIIMSIILIAAGEAYPATQKTSDEYEDLALLRKKIVRMKRELDTFIKEVVSESPEQQNLLSSYGEGVKVDLAEDEKSYIVKADLPGMAKDKIDITLENNKVLKIAGKRDVAQGQTSPGVVMQERMQGEFERVIELPGEGMSSGLTATYNEGVLEISIPKKKPSKEEKIKIKIQ